MNKCKMCDKTVKQKTLSKFSSGNFCSIHCARSYSTKNDNASETKVCNCTMCDLAVIVNKRSSPTRVKCDTCKLANTNCWYGCGQTSKFYITSKKRPSCSATVAGCPSIKAANATGVRRAYADGHYKNKKVDYEKIAKTKKEKYHKYAMESDFITLPKSAKRYRVMIEQDSKCLHCCLSSWNNKSIVLEFDHIDGDNKNDIRDNLRFLCPNCHSQTDTFRGKNIKRKIITDAELVDALQISKNIKQALEFVGLVGKGGNYQRAYKLLEDMVISDN